MAEAATSTPAIEAALATLLPRAVEGIRTPPGVKEGGEAAAAVATPVVPEVTSEQQQVLDQPPVEEKAEDKKDNEVVKDIEPPKLQPPVELGAVETPQQQQTEESQPAPTGDVEMSGV